MILTLLVLAVLAAAPLNFFLARQGRSKLTACVPFAALCVLAWLYPEIAQQREILEQHSWIPSLGINFAFRADGLSYLLALLITGIGSAVFLYAATYLDKHRDLPRFFLFLTLFMGAMLGAVLANDLIVMMLFWELTSISSFMLIGFEPEKMQTRRAAQQGLLITVGGGLALLASCLLMRYVSGTFQIDQIIAQSSTILAHPLASTMMVLLAIGAFAKSAQAPLHIWLPNAMVAPTPVSAYLHSATMVKLGIYLLARFHPAFSQIDLWTPLLTAVGLLTIVIGAFLTLRESDLKRILAYSTVTSLGLLVVLLGLSEEIAIKAMLLFLTAHALYKACLFLVAGIIDHETGTRNCTQLSGLRKVMPKTALVALLGGFSMAGLPPLYGFIAKEYVYESTLAAGNVWLVTGVVLVTNSIVVLAALLVAIRCFWHSATPSHPQAHDPPFSMLIGPAVLAVLGFFIGVMPGPVVSLLSAATSAVHGGEPMEVSLSLWHGVTPMLKLSVVTLLLGLVLYAGWRPLQAWLQNMKSIDNYGVNTLWDYTMNHFPKAALWCTQQFQNGSLRSYLITTLIATAGLSGATLFMLRGFAAPSIKLSEFSPVAVIAILLLVSGYAVVRATSFMAGIAAAGMVGFCMSLLFLFRGAPDLAFTQFSVEAIAIVILLAIIGKMPFYEADYRTFAERWRDSLISAFFGMVATVILISVTSGSLDDKLSKYYRDASVPDAHGHNVVNVIIVDFRALDTLGEITVLTLAALAAMAVITSARLKRKIAPTPRPTELPQQEA